MKKIILALAALALSFGAVAQGQVQERDYIELNTRASREVTPDEIFLQIILDQNDTKGKYTIDQLEKQLYAALKKAGVDADKELKVKDVSSDLKSFLLKKNEGRVTKEYTLKVSDQQVMPVFRELDAAGIQNVNMLSTRYSKYKEVYEELLAEAVVTAKSRATAMVKAADMPIGNRNIGKLIFIQNYDNSSAYDTAPAANGMMLYKSRAVTEVATPTFEFNKIKIEASVTVRFSL